jgi:pimeloyl-ACP methyl ester carboxylesterase
VQRDWLTIKVAGRRLAVQRLRPTNARARPTLVFLHEGLGSIAQWKEFPARLCQRLSLPGVIYDRWGHGRSDPLSGPRHVDYLHDEARLFLPGLLNALGVRRPVLIGHSDGGTIALLFAAAFPEQAAAVITEAAHVFVEDLTLAGIRAAGAAYGQTDLKARLERHHGLKTELLFRGWHECWLAPAFRSWNIEAELARVACPVLALQGEADEYGTAAQIEAIARGVAGPCETALLPECAHAPHQQAEEAALDLMAAFIVGQVGNTGHG